MACDSWIHPNPTWPDIVDSTTGRDGTRWDRALGLAIQEYIDQMCGPFYGLPSPANVAEELAVARGNQDCLDDRLSNGLTPEGYVKLPPNAATKEDIGSLAGRNLLVNDALIVNPDGESAAPYPWVDTTGVTYSITYNTPENTFGTVEVTNASGVTAQVYVELITPADINAFWQAYQDAPGFGFGAYVSSPTVAQVRPFVDDGDSILYGDYHPGGGTRTWLKTTDLPKPVTAQSQYLRVGFEVIAGATFSFSFPMANLGPVPPEHWRSTPYREVIVPFNTVGTNLDGYVGTQTPTYIFMAPGTGILELLATGCAEAVAAGDTITWTLHRWDGAAWEVVDSIGLIEAQQIDSKAASASPHRLLTSVSPHIDLTEPGRMFAYQLELTGVTPWAEAAFVSTRWRVWDTPLASLYSAP